MKDVLVFLEYLETGIIPVTGFSPENIVEFENLMASLSPQEKRIANRKFRKVFRKIAKREMANPKKSTSGWEIVYGVGSSQPSPSQLKARRRLVHDEIVKTIKERVKNA